jgi:DNA (cytosine-5)-methyltransferase 1
LNLYAGIGGNRKLWDNVEVTAVEYVPEIAAIYQDFFPEDTVVVADAHQYLLDHFQEFDFIWSSPPCPTHSRLQFSPRSRGNGGKLSYPDMKLYEEIILLKTFYEGSYIIENVISYYDALIKPQEVARHYFWSNKHLPKFYGKTVKVDHSKGNTLDVKMAGHGIVIDNWHGYKGDKRQLLSNAIEPELGLHLFDAVKGTHNHTKGIELVALDLELL